MAITIQSSPQTLNTASNPCVFTFSSTNTGQTNFSFLVELTVNGSIHSFHQVFPESSNYGKFDCSEILKNTLTSDIIVDGTLATNYTSAICTYKIRVKEKYGDPVAEQGAWVSSSTLRAINGSLKHQDWISYDYQDYDMISTSGALFLTSFPRDEKYYCGLNESVFLGYLTSDGAATGVGVVLYDVTGSVIAQDLSNPVASGQYLTVMDISPQSIIDNTSITSADFDTCYYYEFGANTGNIGEETETFRIYMDLDCTQYTTRRLHWLNKFGVWDSYTFNKYSEESGDVVSSSYQTERGNWNASNAWVYNQYAGESKSFAKISTNKLLLNSDWIKEDKHNWLMESLLESPKVYLEISQGVFEPVIVSNQSWTKKRKIRHKLIQESIRVERTYKYTSQLA